MKRDKEEAGRRGTVQAASSEILGANSEIGRKLRQYYDGLVAEEVPDRFAQLLSQLEQVESSNKPE